MCALALAVFVTNGYKGFFSYYNDLYSAYVVQKCNNNKQ